VISRYGFFKADADTDYFNISLNRYVLPILFGPILEADIGFSPSIYMIKMTQ